MNLNVEFNIIAAHDQHRGIGINGGLPWALRNDMAFFKSCTQGELYNPNANASLNTVIMGRATWESIPCQYRPLIGRKNIVLSRQNATQYQLPVVGAGCLSDALAMATGEIFVIGGGALYQDAIQDPRCKQLYITEIAAAYNCDAFFPEYLNHFKCVDVSEPVNERGVQYSFKRYVRI